MTSQVMEKSNRMVCFGDSIAKSFAKHLEIVLNRTYPSYQVEIINKGIPGETTCGGKKRIDDVLSLNPDLVIINYGMNDWKKHEDKNLFKSNIGWIIDRLLEKNIVVIINTINPDNNKNDQISDQIMEYNKIIIEVASEKNIYIADIFTAWTENLSIIKKGLYDEIHPNDKIGNEITCRAIIKAFNKDFEPSDYTCHMNSIEKWILVNIYPTMVRMLHYFYDGLMEKLPKHTRENWVVLYPTTELNSSEIPSTSRRDP